MGCKLRGATRGATRRQSNKITADRGRETKGSWTEWFSLLRRTAVESYEATLRRERRCRFSPASYILCSYCVPGTGTVLYSVMYVPVPVYRQTIHYVGSWERAAPCSKYMIWQSNLCMIVPADVSLPVSRKLTGDDRFSFLASRASDDEERGDDDDEG